MLAKDAKTTSVKISKSRKPLETKTESSKMLTKIS